MHTNDTKEGFDSPQVESRGHGPDSATRDVFSWEENHGVNLIERAKCNSAVCWYTLDQIQNVDLAACYGLDDN